jgi:hypothetical protein
MRMAVYERMQRDRVQMLLVIEGLAQRTHLLGMSMPN